MTGRLWEYDFCGGIVDFWKGSTEYKPWMKCVREIIAHFSENNNPEWDINDPEGICSDLFYYVAEALGVDNMSELQVFPAFDTPFDRWHGVDLFFVYKNRIVTVDLTVNPNKDSYKANVIVNPETDLVWMGQHIAARLN